MAKWFLALTLLPVLALTAWAAVIKIEPEKKNMLSNKAAHKYFDKIESIRKGDVLVFGDKSRLRVKKRIDDRRGSTTAIFTLDKNWIVRFPLVLMSSEFPQKTVDGYSILRSYGVPMPQVLLPEKGTQSFVPFAVAQRFKIKMMLADFLANRGEVANLSQEEWDQLKNAFVKFIEKMAVFEYIGDFRPDQVALTEEGEWVLLDWNDYTRTVDPENFKTEEEFVKGPHPFSAVVDTARGGLKPTEIKLLRVRLANDNLSDPNVDYILLIGQPGWEKLRPVIISTIENTRRALYRKYKGDLKKMLEGEKTIDPLKENAETPRPKCLKNALLYVRGHSYEE